MRGTLYVTLATVLYSLVQARSVSKELIELNNHINTQFGFDYSNDEEFFSLIGVDLISGDIDSESDSYEYYDFVPYTKHGQEIKDEYDENERNAGAIDAVKEVDKNEYNLLDEGDEQKKGNIVIPKFEDRDEFGENGFVDDYDDEENPQINDNLVLVQSKEDKTKYKEIAYVKSNKDDNYVNDYDETHENISDEDDYVDNVNKEEEEDDYNEDYDYEGDESEEHNESYYDNGEKEVNEEEYNENDEDEDYYENYDYNENGDKTGNGKVNEGNEDADKVDGHIDENIYEEDNNNDEPKFDEQEKGYINEDTNQVKIDIDKLDIENVKKVESYGAEESEEYDYDHYEYTFNNN